MPAYYSEFDPYAAQWLRNLIAAGHIAPGDVDERSIEDVHPDDLRPYTQCHFFAGIGVWSHALRRAGWADDRPVWTGSCPCQPFSSAGEGAGFDDPRHLWPHFAWLIRERRPPVIFGEQVASKDADPWVDLVQADVETMEYAFGAVAFPSAGVGAPHIRDRTYWVADANRDGRQPRGEGCPTLGYGPAVEPDRGISRLGNPHSAGPQGRSRRAQSEGSAAPLPGFAGRLANSSGSGRREERPDAGGLSVGDAAKGLTPGSVHGELLEHAGPVNGLWREADWLFCRDGKWRPVEPGTFPLAHGTTSRVGRLRAYGNALNAEAATQFIAAYLESI
ncbi:DNA cytosine methyltransferase [Pseudomonas typographi]|uniref:DNA cytosine methyltransferase n=1 Tax=Pseudomonas typographi TaxID=2715964 RepID=UPI001681E0D0|nr:DNA cytosine methyltransferase [Pseudomonas typographi]MBD1553856.1 DNA cytosine methyltransferase [Pseudomonas typographi]